MTDRNEEADEMKLIARERAKRVIETEQSEEVDEMKLITKEQANRVIKTERNEILPKFIENIEKRIRKILKKNNYKTKKYYEIGEKFYNKDYTEDEWNCLCSEIEYLHSIVTIPIFKFAKNYKELLSLFYMYLEGKIISTPVHTLPLISEQPLKNVLKSFVLYGILIDRIEIGGATENILTREFIKLYLPFENSTFQALCYKLIKDEQFIVQVATHCIYLNPLQLNTQNWEILDTHILKESPKEEQLLKSNHGLRFPISYEIKDQEYHLIAEIPVELDESIFDDIMTMSKMELPQMVVIHIADKKFGASDLLWRVFSLISC